MILFLLLLFVRCSPQEEAEVLSPEQQILQIMKEDEKVLLSYYERSDICSKEWIEDFYELANKFKTYEYTGSDEEIKALLKDYIEYGDSLLNILLVIEEENYTEGVLQLEELKEEAARNEGELNRLYETYHQEN